MSDLKERLQESGMPVRQYGTAAVYFKKTCTEYADAKLKDLDDNGKTALAQAKLKYQDYMNTYNAEFKDWVDNNQALAAEYAEYEAAQKAANAAKKKPQSGDAQETTDAPKKKQKKPVDADGDEEDRPSGAFKSDDGATNSAIYRGSFASLSEDVDGEEMQQMVDTVLAFKKETQRINTEMLKYNAQVTDVIQLGRKLDATYKEYTKMAAVIIDKLDEASYSIIERRKARNVFKN